MEVLIKPLITEKMTAVTEKFPTRYGFIVNKKATKSQIKHAVEEMYGVEVDSVNTMVYLGKSQTRYTRTGIQTGRKSSFKKAIVTLNEGETIDFYSNI